MYVHQQIVTTYTAKIAIANQPEFNAAFWFVRGLWNNEFVKVT
ncbi:hypothetical protein AB0758_21050 [Tolypothrix bouteillei VB521301_2]